MQSPNKKWNNKSRPQGSRESQESGNHNAYKSVKCASRSPTQRGGGAHIRYVTLSPREEIYPKPFRLKPDSDTANTNQPANSTTTEGTMMISPQGQQKTICRQMQMERWCARPRGTCGLPCDICSSEIEEGTQMVRKRP